MVSTITMPVDADRPPMKARSASSGCCCAIGRVSTKVSASTLPPGKLHQPAERDRQHEDIDRKQIERKQPDRLVEMALVDVFHHRDLELARQEHDGEHRQKGQRGPARVIAAFAAEHGQGIELRHGGRAAKDVVEAVVDAEGHEQADGDKCQQLDQRFERDGGDQAFMPLGRVEVARAEENGEGREQHRDVERVVAEKQRRAALIRHDHMRILAE